MKNIFIMLCFFISFVSCSNTNIANTNNTNVIMSTNDDGSIVFEQKDIVYNIDYIPNVVYANKDNTKLALILSGINILVFGLFIYFFINSFTKGIVNAINSISSSLSMFTSTSVTESINVPFFEFFITGIITMAIFLLALSLMTKLFAGVIFKNKKTVNEYLVLYGITSPINTITTLIAIIFSFISYKLSLIVILIGTVMYFVSISQSLLDIYKVNKERFPYIVAFILTTAYIITIVALVIVLSILIYNQNAALYY